MASEIEGIVRTKLNRPRLPPDLVMRDRLLKRLDGGRTLPLTLISAPAGCGKSTLVAGWLERIDWPGVWLSVDSQDSDPRRFLTHVIAGLRTAFPQACSPTMDLLRAPTDLFLRALKTTLANDLEALERPFVLVLDDFEHVEAGSPVNDILGDLLAHPPLPLHLVVISRRDPPTPLVTLRARAQLAKIRMADLRFARSEARGLIEQAGGFSVSDDSLASVERELEGWAVGLRLLSLALCADSDPNATLRNLHSGWNQAREYLFQQVLAQQPAAVRDWLLKSSVLERFCGALCDAVCSADANGELRRWTVRASWKPCSGAICSLFRSIGKANGSGIPSIPASGSGRTRCLEAVTISSSTAPCFMMPASTCTSTRPGSRLRWQPRTSAWVPST
ncbi:MAG: AAA family ATPase [Burkholderiales bacterium]|nr:MAG: AAA family ATPase [Burkholderiales bacterium]